MKDPDCSWSDCLTKTTELMLPDHAISRKTDSKAVENKMNVALSGYDQF